LMFNGSRLVARMRSRGQSASTRSASVAAAVMTCSQLSSTSSAARSRNTAVSRSMGSPGAPISDCSRRPSAPALRPGDLPVR
jgi:hypothetical protein